MLDTRARLDGGSVDDGRKAKSDARPNTLFPLVDSRFWSYLRTSQNRPKRLYLNNSCRFAEETFAETAPRNIAQGHWPRTVSGSFQQRGAAGG